MKKSIIIFVLATFSFTALYAQEVGPSISWDEPTYDFGDVSEQDGKVTHSYTFTNSGSESLVITNVHPSCGCTTSDYTELPVAPGDSGFVSASFDPNHRVGQNSKSITVTTNGNPATTTLWFTVNVIPKPKTIEDEYPSLMGDLRLKTNHIALMKIEKDKVIEEELEVVNTHDYPITITFKNTPKHIELTAVPETLEPNMTGKILVKYDSGKKTDFGFLLDRITVAVNGETNQNKNQLSISATIEEDYSSLTEEQKEKAPKIKFKNQEFDFGTIDQGQSVEYIFEFDNIGKSDLLVRKIQPSCGCTIVNSSKELIAPGESAELKVRFNSAGKSDQQNKTITMITNDPKDPQIVLLVSGFVTVPE